MIYLEKGKAKVSMNDEGVAIAFEKDGYTRIKGRRYLALVVGKAAKETFLEFVLPVSLGLALFHICDGQDHLAFVAAAYAVCVISRLSK